MHRWGHVLTELVVELAGVVVGSSLTATIVDVTVVVVCIVMGIAVRTVVGSQGIAAGTVADRLLLCTLRQNTYICVRVLIQPRAVGKESEGVVYRICCTRADHPGKILVSKRRLPHLHQRVQ